MMKKERLLAITASRALELDMIDDAEHVTDPELITSLEDKMKEWGYLMAQYNLKAGLRKCGNRGATVAMEELTQLLWTLGR